MDKQEEIFAPPAAQSTAAGEDPPSGLDQLNDNIEQLLETVDAVAADVAESRSHLERLTRSPADDHSDASGVGGIEDRIRVHTADFHRWIENDRRRRRWCARRSLPGRCQPFPFFGGSASALPVSRTARRSLALRPTWSLSCPGRPVAPECFSRSRYLLQPLRLLPDGATVAGRGSHPLGDSTFPRRTNNPG